MNKFEPHEIKCNQCPIRHRAVCSNCNSSEMEILEALKSYRNYKAGANVLWRGDELYTVASVVEGVATLSKSMEDGRNQMVGLLFPGDFIGRPGRVNIDFDVTASTDLTLCCFDRKKFEQLIHDVPHIAQRMAEIALDELDAARDWMLLLGRKTAGEKIATFLEMVARRQLIDQHSHLPNQLELPLLRSEIADYLGLTLETVSRQLSILKKQKIVNFSGKRSFYIEDLSRLHEATGDDSDGGMWG